jgi:purine-binding chemotaxis protein CheW
MSQFSLVTIPPYQFLIELENLQEVLSIPEISPVPKSPLYIRGIVPLRGRLCTVICLPTLLGVPRSNEGQKKLVVIDHALGTFSIEATDVDIISLHTSAITPPSNLPFFDWVKGMYIDTEQKTEMFLLDFSYIEEALLP